MDALLALDPTAERRGAGAPRVTVAALPYGQLLNARALGFPEPIEPRRHVVHFTHPEGALPDGFFYCPACVRLVTFTGWMDAVCPGGAA